VQMRQTEKMIQAQKDSDLVILAGVECNYTFRFGLDLPDRVISVNRSEQKGRLVNRHQFKHKAFQVRCLGLCLPRNFHRILGKVKYGH